MTRPLPDLRNDLSWRLSEIDESLQAETDFGKDAAAAGLAPQLERLRSCLRLLERDRRRTLHLRTSLQEAAIHVAVSNTADGLVTDDKHTTVRHISRFRILQPLGQGGFGRVFLAADPNLNRLVAIKIPRAKTLATPDLQHRFIRESQFVARLHHPHLVPIFEAGQDGPITYLVTEYCAGGNLAEWLKRKQDAESGMPQRGRLAVNDCTELIISIAEGVHHAHQHGILHRDLKPANILLHPIDETAKRKTRIRSDVVQHANLCENFRPMVADFGLAKLLDDSVSSSDIRLKGADSSTAHHSILAGTLAYMAPEQLEGRVSDLGPATDVYGLGLILFELLTGRRMFYLHAQIIPEGYERQTIVDVSQPASGANSVASSRVKDQIRIPVPPQSLRPDVSRDLNAICLKCVAPDIAHRYATAQELADDLRAFSRGEAVRARPWPWHEQLVRWAQRRPAIASLLMFCGVLTLSLFGFGVWHLQQLTALNRELEKTSLERQQQSDAAMQQSRRADEQRELALRENQRSTDLAWLARQREYSAEIMQAAAFFQAGEIAQMNEALKRFLPSPQLGQTELGATLIGGVAGNRKETHRAEPLTRSAVAVVLASQDDPRGPEWWYLWNQGRRLRPWPGHLGSVVAAAFTDDRSHCYTIAKDDTIRLWNAHTGQLQESWRLDREGPSSQLAAEISRDGSRAVIVRDLDERGIDEGIIWDLHTGQVVMRREFPLHSIQSQSISSDGRTVAIGGTRNQDGLFAPFAQLWRPDGEAVIGGETAFREMTDDASRPPVHSVASLAFVPGQNAIAVGLLVNGPGYWQHRFLHCSLETDATENSPVASSAVVTTEHQQHGQLSDSEHYAVDHSSPASKLTWGVPVSVGQLQNGTIESVQFSPSGQHFAVRVGPPGNRVDVWDWKIGELLRSSEQFYRRPDAIAFDEVGRSIGIALTMPGLTAEGNPAQRGDKVVTLATSELRRWDFQTGTSDVLEYPVKRDITFMQPIPASFGGDWFVGESGGTANLWQPNTTQLSQSLPGHGANEVWGLAYSPDGSKLFSVGDDHAIRSWDPASGRELASSTLRSTLVSCVAASPDGRWVAAGGYDDQVFVHRPDTLEIVATLKDHTNDIRTVAFSPDSRLLASAGRDKVIHVWDVATFTVVRTLRGHHNTIRALQWMSNGQLISSDSDGRIIVWSSDGLIIHERREPDGVHSLAFAPKRLRMSLPDASDSQKRIGAEMLVAINSEELLAFGTRHGRIRLWHLPTDNVWFDGHHPAVDIRALAFSTDGRTLAAAGDDNFIHFWHTATRREILRLDGVDSPINHICFSPDGRRFAMALHSGTIQIRAVGDIR